jgi:hypothetical protein
LSEARDKKFNEGEIDGEGIHAHLIPAGDEELGAELAVVLHSS